ncbi:hypothetical protein L873DRAFT_341387 [Choiromyces venosus 120613-1]|uniref:Uncharacterized protein n=1 Tax=Choiromyces venosus 120613-1 TaxID=1336337 RepID=A0A3N4IYH9_9PEZI|nr:hypothetical protein L873DRAFT_341387 [Choiromyces venosus 120613-1]
MSEYEYNVSIVWLVFGVFYRGLWEQNCSNAQFLLLEPGDESILLSRRLFSLLETCVQHLSWDNFCCCTPQVLTASIIYGYPPTQLFRYILAPCRYYRSFGRTMREGNQSMFDRLPLVFFLLSEFSLCYALLLVSCS